MKKFEVELRRTSFIIVTVEAENADEAEALAFDTDAVKQETYASWDIESVEEVTNQGESK